MVRLLAILTLPFSFLYGQELMVLLLSYNFNNPLHLIFVVSTIFSFFICLIFISSGSFIAIFEHELTHNILAIMTFKAPTGFIVEKGTGGLFQFNGGGNFLITLAPYFFLTVPILIFPLYFVIDAEYLRLYYIAIGIGTGFQIATTIKEIHPKQPDLMVHGLFYSYILILFLNIISYGMLIGFTQDGITGIYSFINNGLQNTVQMLPETWIN